VLGTLPAQGPFNPDGYWRSGTSANDGEMPRLWRTRHVLRRGRDTPDQLGREAFLNKMLIIGTCCDLLRLGRSPFLLPSRLARAVEAMSGPLIWTGRESNPRPTRIHFEGVTAILELGVPNKGEGCFEWRSLRSTGVNRSDTIRAHGDARQAHLTGLIPAQPSFLLAPATFPGWSGFSVSGNQPSCCALATSTRPSLSPSRCWLVLRQHRSACGYCCATDV